jgi:thioredoxin-related protein
MCNYSVRTSQEAHYISIKEPSLLMLFGETAAVYCENLTEHNYTLCYNMLKLHIIATKMVKPYLVPYGAASET